MSSKHQMRANRANARLSTGPKTERGKRAVRWNGLSHGLLSLTTVLPGEDKQAFEQMRKSLHEDLQPSGAVERLLVDRAVDAVWRLRRLTRNESFVLEQLAVDLRIELASAQLQHLERASPLDEFDALSPFAKVIADEQAHAKLSGVLAKLQADRDKGDIVFGQAFQRALEADTFHKLSRYEATLERSFYKAIHELQRLQAMRRGAAVPAPQVLDVDVSLQTQP